MQAAAVRSAAAGAEDAAFAFAHAVLARAVVRGLVVAVVGRIVFLARRRGAFRGVVDVVVVSFRRHNAEWGANAAPDRCARRRDRRSRPRAPQRGDRRAAGVGEDDEHSAGAGGDPPPGTGKPPPIPPALAATGRTILLQPRRVAARALARRIAVERGWTIGNEIGWQIRFERKFSGRTRLLVATEGILTARLQSDPLLSDFDVIILDEFHEPSIHADVALALANQAMDSRDDLAVVVMSATIAAEDVSNFLGGARVFDVGARRFPIDVRYKPGISMSAAIREQ